MMPSDLEFPGEIMQQFNSLAHLQANEDLVVINDNTGLTSFHGEEIESLVSQNEESPFDMNNNVEDELSLVALQLTASDNVLCSAASYSTENPSNEKPMTGATDVGEDNVKNTPSMFQTNQLIHEKSHHPTQLDDGSHLRSSQSSQAQSSRTTKSPTNLMQETGKRESFTAETPYFGAYVDRELRHLTILSETLYDISARARAAGQAGAAMAEANRKLSSACKLFPTYDRNGDDWISAMPNDEEGKSRERRICEARKEAVGKEMGSVLLILGEVCKNIN